MASLQAALTQNVRNVRELEVAPVPGSWDARVTWFHGQQLDSMYNVQSWCIFVIHLDMNTILGAVGLGSILTSVKRSKWRRERPSSVMDWLPVDGSPTKNHPCSDAAFQAMHLCRLSKTTNKWNSSAETRSLHETSARTVHADLRTRDTFRDP